MRCTALAYALYCPSLCSWPNFWSGALLLPLQAPVSNPMLPTARSTALASAPYCPTLYAVPPYPMRRTSRQTRRTELAYFAIRGPDVAYGRMRRRKTRRFCRRARTSSTRASGKRSPSSGPRLN
eukprot:1768299-Rhodomonas_salina.1